MLIGLDKPLSTPRRWRERLLPDGGTELPANIHGLGLIAIPESLHAHQGKKSSSGRFYPNFLFIFFYQLAAGCVEPQDLHPRVKTVLEAKS